MQIQHLRERLVEYRDCELEAEIRRYTYNRRYF